MGSKSGNDNRAPITVEAWVVDERDLRGEVQATEGMGGIVSLAHGFSPVSERAVAQHKADAAQGKILAVIVAEAAVHNGAADPVVLPVPGIARGISAKAYGVIHLAKGERFISAIVPAGA